MQYRHLFELIDDNYNLEELRFLCSSLGIDYENLPGDSKKRKAMELQEYLRRRGQLSKLIEEISRERGHLDLTPFGGPPPREETAPDNRTTSVAPSQSTQPSAQDTISEYANFDIQIDPRREDGQYPLSASASDGSKTEQLLWRTLPTDQPFQDALYYLKELTASPDDAELLGERLREFLFPDRVWALYSRLKAKSGDRVRVRLNIRDESPELNAIPWEYCRDDRLFLALNESTPLVRYIPVDRQESSIAAPGKVKILVAVASPKDQPLLAIDGEESRLRETLSELESDGKVAFKIIRHVTKRDLHTNLVRYNPHVLHFVGHGLLQASGEGALALEDRNGNTALADARDMMLLLQSSQVKLVLLAACQTAVSGETHGKQSAGFMGVAPKLVWAGVPAVIAMQFVVPEETAYTFTHDMYQFLAAGKPLDAAVTQARIGAYFDDKVFWGIPVLFMRSPNGVIW